MHTQNIEEDRKKFSSQADSAIVLPQHMIEEKKATFVDELIVSGHIHAQEPQVRRMLEDYAYLLYRMSDHARYRGIISTLNSENLFKQVMTFFTRKSLEPAEDKKTTPGGLIVNPYG